MVYFSFIVFSEIIVFKTNPKQYILTAFHFLLFSFLITVSKEAIDKLAPSLAALVQRGTGLATRAMSARVIVRLATSCPKLLKTHAQLMLRPLSNGLTDRSVTVRKEFGKAIGQVARLSKRRAVEKLVERLLSQYTESDVSDERARHASGVAIYALVTTAPSRIKRCMLTK